MKRLLVTVVGLFLAVQVVPAADDTAADALPSNLGHSLRQLIVWHRAQPGSLTATERQTRLTKSLPARARRVQANADATRAVVDVTLNGSLPPATVRQSLTELGAEVFAQYDAHRAGSVLSVHLPLDRAEAAARLPGVHAVSLAHRPWRNVGKATSQGTNVLKTAQTTEAHGYDGTGITIGVLSDSFDLAEDTTYYKFATHANQDVANGDLPGPGNPYGHSSPVRVIRDGYHFPGATDEGRAMLQIIHDIAPGAKLVFETAGKTAAELASGISTLRSQTYGTQCDVIVDDFTFPEEPFFSDGPAALMAKNVGVDPTLPGSPAVYVSAAGNNGDVGYAADFALVGDADARAGVGAGNLKLDQVPSRLTQGGFHNFNPRPGKTSLAQKVKLRGDAEVSFQWDDVFIPGKITTDYNLLVFDADGNYLPDLSGTDDNFGLGAAVEVVDLPLGDDGKTAAYQFAIARTSTGSGEARHLRYVMNGGDPTIKFAGYNQPTTFGHNAGANVIGVAAYAYDKLDEPEAYSSMGPATIYFDALGQRLAVPEVRQQPAVAAVDGVNTSFFPPGPLTLPDGSPGTDTEGDGLPNFFGTSAAAPHVAAIVALLLQANGGPGSLTPAQVLHFLQTTALPHDLDPNALAAVLSADNGSAVTLSALSDESNRASGEKNAFHLTFNGPSGMTLRKLVLDLGETGLRFDPSSENGLSFTVGTKVGLKPTDVSAVISDSHLSLTLKFLPGTFVPGKSLDFGIDRDLAATGTDGNSADLLAGAVVKARLKDAAGNHKAQGALSSRTGTGYSPAVGFGLVDAQTAVEALLAAPPTPTVPGLPLRSGDLLITSSQGFVFETKRDGVVVGILKVPDPMSNAANHLGKPRRALVDGRGNLVILNGSGTPNVTYLTTVDSRTGAVNHITAPKWNQSTGGDIASNGRYIFATFGQSYLIENPPANTLLRFDLDNGEVQPFAPPLSAFEAYTNLAMGPDGLLYASANKNGFAVGFNPGSSLDVYDPNTLAFVRTVTLDFGTMASGEDTNGGTLAIDASGDIYAEGFGGFTIRGLIFHFDPSGHLRGTIPLPIKSPFGNYDSLRIDAQGTIAVSYTTVGLINPADQSGTEFKLDPVGASTPDSPPGLNVSFIP